jgi:hypothetical protein
MSSDNGTYVLQTYGPEWRVARMSAVENLFEEQNPDTLKWTPNIKTVVETFKESKVFTSFEEAWDVATAMENKDETEYGLSLIRDFETVKYADIQSQYIKTYAK